MSYFVVSPAQDKKQASTHPLNHLCRNNSLGDAGCLAVLNVIAPLANTAAPISPAAEEQSAVPLFSSKRATMLELVVLEGNEAGKDTVDRMQRELAHVRHVCL